jgi:hypothetical protein
MLLYIVKIADAFDIIKEWLNKCDSLRILDSNFNRRIKLASEDAIQNGIIVNIPLSQFPQDITIDQNMDRIYVTKFSRIFHKQYTN